MCYVTAALANELRKSEAGKDCTFVLVLVLGGEGARIGTSWDSPPITKLDKLK
jgi:hypothetical protein